MACHKNQNNILGFPGGNSQDFEGAGAGVCRVWGLAYTGNITAAIGAFGFGIIQDRIGSVKTLMLTLTLWCIAIFLVWSSNDITIFWVAANLIGMALGASQSASRLVGTRAPV